MSESTQPPARRPDIKDFQSQARNPFSGDVPAMRPVGAIANAEQQRAIAEVQARMIIARSNPRNAMNCMDAILRDCTRPSLAKDALYQYARGGSSVSGPSIRLAEAIARRWGNIASGIKEVSRDDGYSECVAYAWDLETGYYDERQYQVKHWRDTKGGGYRLTDERDIYELIANMGQRRKRAVLLTVIPGDVVEAAVDQCEETLNSNADTSPEALVKMIKAFEQFNVTKPQIEARCQCRIEAIRPAQIVQLSKIFTSLMDGMSSPGDWFENNMWTRATADPVTPPAKPAGAPQSQTTNTRPPTNTRATRAPAQPEQAAPVDTKPPADDNGGPPLGWDDGIPPDDKPATAGQQAPATAAPASRSPEPGPERDTQAAAPAPEDKGPPPDASGGPGARFEAYVLDEHGDLASETGYTDPVLYARALSNYWHAATNKDTVLHQNTDGIQDALATGHPIVREVLTEILASPAADDDARAGPVVIELTMDRGKPQVGPYLTAFKAAQPGLMSGEDVMDFLAANTETMRKLPTGTRTMAVKALVETCGRLQITPPAILADLVAPPVRQEDRPADAGPAAPADDPDWKAANNRIAELRACATMHSLEAMGRGVVLKSFGERMKREGREDVLRAIDAAYLARQAELKGA